MAVSEEFYRNIYGGRDYDGIDRFLERAAEFIDGKMTAPPAGAYQEKQYALAVCAQAEYMGFKGGYEAWLSEKESHDCSSVKLGSFSFSSGSSYGRTAYRSASVMPPGMCQAAYGYLERGGLLYRGCTSCR